LSENTTFDLIVRTSNAISLVHRFVDYFISRHDDGKFCAVVVVGKDGKILASAGMSGCSDHLFHLAALQAKQAIKDIEVRYVDRMNGKGPIKGHFGSVSFAKKGLYVGFYVRRMNADDAADIIKRAVLQQD
jgi:hypothetical protein